MFEGGWESINATDVLPTLVGSSGASGTAAGAGAGAFTLVKRDPLYIVIPMTVLYASIFTTGLVGNLVTCIVIARNRHMQTATNYYLFSLAVSDLLLLISGLPQEIYVIWSRYPYVFGEGFCVARGLASETSANATVLTITAFTVERYIAICHPFLAHTTSNLSRALKSIFVIWLVALTFATPQALQFGIVRIRIAGEDVAICTQKKVLLAHSFEISTFLFFVLPMTLITVLYALIGLRLRSSGIRSGARPAKATPCKQHASSQRVLRMLVAVVVAFFICWAPFHAQRLVAIYGADKSSSETMLAVYEVITYLSGILYYVSTTINPILYHIMSHKFREAFKETLGCCRRGGNGNGEYSVLSRGQTDSSQPGSSIRTVRRQQFQHQQSDQQIKRDKSSSLYRRQSERDFIDQSVKRQQHEASTSTSQPESAPSPVHGDSGSGGDGGKLCCGLSSCLPPSQRSQSIRCPECRHNISNSSLKDLDRAALRDELVDYLNLPTDTA